MTVIMTLVGLVVFFISLFKVGFKSALMRLLMFTGVGLVIDVVLSVFAAFVFYHAL